MFDRRRALNTIVARRDPKSGDRTVSPTPMKNEVVKKEDGELDGQHLAAQGMIAALKEGSAQKLNEAMNDHYALRGAKKAK